MSQPKSAQRIVKELRDSIPPNIWPEPDVLDSYVFLVSEVGEIGDALMRSSYSLHEYTRNRDRENGTSMGRVEHEIGDTMLMLCTLATAMGVNLDVALAKRVVVLRSKYGKKERDCR